MIGPIRWGTLDRRTPVEVSQVSLAFERLPAAFEGFRIALLADLHYGRFVRDGYVRKVLDLTKQQRPDLLVLCGDMVNLPRKRGEELMEMIAAGAGGSPIFAVPGNHERFRQSREFFRVFRAGGADVLVNERRLIRRGPAEAIALAGLDEPKWGRPDLRAALEGIDSGTFTILASHSPDLADCMPADLRADLMLSGHTHGGQVRLFGRALITKTRNRKYVSGLTAGPRFPIYISRGLGVTRIPLRFACEAELPIITLRRP